MVCKSCRRGYEPSPNNDGCRPCGPGTASLHGQACVACTHNTYYSGYKGIKCLKCPLHSHSIDRETMCQCNYGYYYKYHKCVHKTSGLVSMDDIVNDAYLKFGHTSLDTINEEYED